MKEGSRSKITKARHKEARDVPCLAAGARDSRHQRGQPKLRGECSMPLEVAEVCPVVFRVACCTVVSLLFLAQAAPQGLRDLVG